MAVRLFLLAEGFVQLGQLQMGFAHVLRIRVASSSACFQVALGLAPQLLAQAQRAQGQRQPGVARVFAQPALALLDLGQQRGEPSGPAASR
jgi:hypothetical protein